MSSNIWGCNQPADLTQNTNQMSSYYFEAAFHKWMLQMFVRIKRKHSLTLTTEKWIISFAYWSAFLYRFKAHQGAGGLWRLPGISCPSRRTVLRFSVSCNLLLSALIQEQKRYSAQRNEFHQRHAYWRNFNKKAIYAILRWKKFKDKPVPDPAHSSVATWLSACDQKVNSIGVTLGRNQEEVVI